MNNALILAAAIAVSFFSGAPANAKMSGMMGVVGCSANENASISISFNGTGPDAEKVKTRLDEKINAIKELAKEQHFDKFSLQSSNYNINANGNSYNGSDGGEIQFNYNASASFTLLPVDKAIPFMALLVKKGYQASASINGYHNGNCDQSGATD